MPLNFKKDWCDIANALPFVFCDASIFREPEVTTVSAIMEQCSVVHVRLIIS